MGALHSLLDHDYSIEALLVALDRGDDPDAHDPVTGETPLGVAARRRRLEAVQVLLERGADPDRTDRHGKSPWAHARRRGFGEVADALARAGASTALTAADRLAVALSDGRLDQAQRLLVTEPGCARTGNAGEDRLLADMAGRPDPRAVRLLLDVGADTTAPGLDGGTALHQAAWFGQPENARMLIDAGAGLDVFDPVHASSPLHWAVHGSRHSGGAATRQEVYVTLVRMLLEAGSRTSYPDGGGPAEVPYAERLLDDASDDVRAVLVAFGVGQARNGPPKS